MILFLYLYLETKPTNVRVFIPKNTKIYDLRHFTAYGSFLEP